MYYLYKEIIQINYKKVNKTGKSYILKVLHIRKNDEQKELHTMRSYISRKLCTKRSYISIRRDIHWKGLYTRKQVNELS